MSSRDYLHARDGGKSIFVSWKQKLSGALYTRATDV